MKIDLQQLTVFPKGLCFWELIKPTTVLQQTQGVPVTYAKALEMLLKYSRKHITLSPTEGTSVERLEEVRIRFESDGISVDIFA